MIYFPLLLLGMQVPEFNHSSPFSFIHWHQVPGMEVSTLFFPVVGTRVFECLLCARHCTSCWVFSRKQNRYGSCPNGAYRVTEVEPGSEKVNTQMRN